MDSLRAAKEEVLAAADAIPDDFGKPSVEIVAQLDANIGAVKAELDGLPSWDPGYVQRLILEYAEGDDTTACVDDGSVLVGFTVPDGDGSTVCEYSTIPGTGEEEVRVLRDGEWAVAWSSE